MALDSILTADERAPKSLRAGRTLSDAIDCFRTETDLRVLPIIDERGRPTGAVFEKDVRLLLLNPFGHALLRNPSIGGDLSEHIRPCPTIEMTEDIGAIIYHYRRCDGREGMILTRGGALYATLSNRRLLMLAADREHEASAARIARAEQIEQSASAFEMRSASLASQMVGLANSVQRLAEATVDRANIAGARAADMGAAASETRHSLAFVADSSKSLAAAFETIEHSLAGNREVGARTVTRVAEGGARARELLSAAKSIDNVMALISNIAGTVNLLSLNATIEAARAGDAGRGFAVVAAEIRKLSDQTQEATSVIATEVEALKSGVELVARDYSQVEQAIEVMAGGAADIDQAITAEGDATRRIAESLHEAGESSISIERSVSTIIESVRSASTSATELDRMANDLRSGASELDASVAAFLDEVRAA